MQQDLVLIASVGGTGAKTAHTSKIGRMDQSQVPSQNGNRHERGRATKLWTKI